MGYGLALAGGGTRGQPMWGCLRPLWRRDCARMQWQEPAQGESWQDFLPPGMSVSRMEQAVLHLEKHGGSIWTGLQRPAGIYAPAADGKGRKPVRSY